MYREVFSILWDCYCWFTNSDETVGMGKKRAWFCPSTAVLRKNIPCRNKHLRNLKPKLAIKVSSTSTHLMHKMIKTGKTKKAAWSSIHLWMATPILCRNGDLSDLYIGESSGFFQNFTKKNSVPWKFARESLFQKNGGSKCGRKKKKQHHQPTLALLQKKNGFGRYLDVPAWQRLVAPPHGLLQSYWNLMQAVKSYRSSLKWHVLFWFSFRQKRNITFLI